MSSHDWKSFLTCWSQEFLTSEDDDLRSLPPGAIKAGWVGYPPAPETQIAAEEARLGVKLPPSYQDFLRVSNGWRIMANPYIKGLRPVEEIEYFPVRMQSWLEAMRSIMNSATMQDLYGIKDDELETTIELSESFEGTILLNPQVATPDGEMEVWFFEAEAGVERFPSFWAMMQDDFKLFLSFKEHDSRQLKDGKQVETVIKRFSGLIFELEEKAAQWRGVQRNHPMDNYNAGILSVMDDTLEALRKMPTNSDDPRALLDQIIRITESMEQTWNKTWPKQQGAAAFVTGLADPGKAIYEGGRTEGMRETIAILRWFLNGAQLG